MHILEMHISEWMSTHNTGVDIRIYVGSALFRGGGNGGGGGGGGGGAGPAFAGPILIPSLKKFFF